MNNAPHSPRASFPTDLQAPKRHCFPWGESPERQRPGGEEGLDVYHREGGDSTPDGYPALFCWLSWISLHEDPRRAGWTEQYVRGRKRTVSGARSSPGKGYFLQLPSRRDSSRPPSMPCSDPQRMPRSIQQAPRHQPLDELPAAPEATSLTTLGDPGQVTSLSPKI